MGFLHWQQEDDGSHLQWRRARLGHNGRAMRTGLEIGKGLASRWSGEVWLAVEMTGSKWPDMLGVIRLRRRVAMVATWIDSSAPTRWWSLHRGYDNESLEVWFGVKGLATVGFSGFREMEQKLWFACGIPQLWCEGSGQVGLKAMVLVVKYFFFLFSLMRRKMWGRWKS